MNKKAFISRNLLGVICLSVAALLIAWGAATKLTVYAAKPVGGDKNAAAAKEPEDKQFIAGSAKSAWAADTSTHTLMNGLTLVEKATISGVARNEEGVYHQTGIKACPT
jgi:hypothetical protein